MSADNGIYILKTPARPIKEGNCYTPQHGFEFRVAHCQAIDSIDYSDLYIPLLFGNSKVYTSQSDATKEAFRLAKEIVDEGFPLEYGVSTIEKDCHFPNMTVHEARHALDTYVLPENHFEFDERVVDIRRMDTDVRLRFPNGKEVTLQWRIENGSLDVCLPEEKMIVTTWEGLDMEHSKAHKDFPDGHVRHCGQLVIELGDSYVEDELKENNGTTSGCAT